MAGFSGRKGPNVSHYLANLNAIPSEHDIATQQAENFDFGNDLAAFTNTEFLEFDQGENVFQSPIDYNHRNEGLNPPDSAGTQDNGKEFVNRMQEAKDASFFSSNNGHKSLVFPDLADLRVLIDFQFQSLEPFYPDTPIDRTIPQLPPHTNFGPQPNLTSPTSINPTPAPGTKRSASAASPTSHLGQEDSSRLAAEEDKRRRNTAASARFRVKKKQREQALEKTAKELNDKTAALEQRIAQLETQNEWLKNLITEKKGKDFLAEEWKAFKRRAAGSETDSGEEGGRSKERKKKGVGTAI
ncbi:MAG: hypothetical protein Q9181_003708 [Wetmoreana brouardii]